MPERSSRIAVAIVLAALFVVGPLVRGQEDDLPTPQAAQVLGGTVMKLLDLVEPAGGTEAPVRTVTTRVRLVKAEGLPKELAGKSAEVAYQWPDKLRVSAEVGSDVYAVGRDGQEIWVYTPAKHFGVIGSPDVPMFAATPGKVDDSKLPAFHVPASRLEIAMALMMVQSDLAGSEKVAGADCRILRLTAVPRAARLLNLPAGGEVRMWVRDGDGLPARVAYSDERGVGVVAEFEQTKVEAAWPAERWKLNAAPGDHIEHVARAHLTRFLSVAMETVRQKVPTLGPATGQRQLVATCGKGRLENIDGTRVLFLAGSPEEMGTQHGTLLKNEIRDVCNHILYGVGVGSSFGKGRWFFREIESAQARLMPFMSERYLREMDAIADAAGMDRQEGRLANFFPELFHCSGFSLFGDATVGGRMYHGRVLDYLKGVGLEQNAVVTVYRPDEGNAWVNIGYAGFIGSVTAMNEKHVSIGEMGGKGQGNWDGKPMAELVREVMEKAGTLDEAVEIMRKGPRTCEYYYVISDGRTKCAVGIRATPSEFEVVKPGEAQPRLPHAIKDAVVLSAGDRYENLVARVKEHYGQIDDESARHLMDRPVAMNSCIHAVLFAPETLDFWVANADSQNPAPACRYTHYNLGELLKSETVEAAPAAHTSSGRGPMGGWLKSFP